MIQGGQHGQCQGHQDAPGSPNSDAPSNRAASSRSLGIVRKNPRMTKIWNGSAKTT